MPDPKELLYINLHEVFSERDAHERRAAIERYVGHDTAALPWRFGPPGSPAARGIDILTVRDGRVSVLRTLLASETDT